MKVEKFLKQRGVGFERWSHRPAYSALQLADEVKAPGYQIAKTVLLRVDGCYYLLAVLPAVEQVDLGHLQEVLDLDKLELASELECGEYFDDCELGAIPPFGSLYGVPTVVAESLTEDLEIIFEGNRHDEAIRMKFTDYYRLEKPRVLRFSEPTQPA